MMNIKKYFCSCVQFFQFMKKGRGGVYLGDNVLLGANVVGQQILTDVRHVPSIRKAWAVKPIEASVMALLSQQIKGGMICAEIGAGCGFYSVFLATLAGPSGKVYSFEPIPECYDLLIKNSRLNDLDTIISINLDVADEIKNIQQTYFDIEYRFFFSPPEGYSKRHLTVETTTLDIYMQNAGETSLDFLKIDGEADLLRVWKGMQEILAMNPEIKILCTIDQNKFGFSDQDLDAFFNEVWKQQFHLYRLPTLESIDKEQLLSRGKGQTILLMK